MKKGRNIEIEKEGKRNNSNGHKSMGGKWTGKRVHQHCTKLHWPTDNNSYIGCRITYQLQRILLLFIRESITVWLTSCLTGLDLTKQVKLSFI